MEEPGRLESWEGTRFDACLLGIPSSDSHHSGASQLCHLPLRQLPTVPAWLPPWPLLLVFSQKCFHHQHCWVSLCLGKGEPRQAEYGNGDGGLRGLSHP